jgi:hypothetical protein
MENRYLGLKFVPSANAMSGHRYHRHRPTSRISLTILARAFGCPVKVINGESLPRIEVFQEAASALPDELGLAIPSAFPALVNPAARTLAIAKRWWLSFQHRCGIRVWNICSRGNRCSTGSRTEKTRSSASDRMVGFGRLTLRLPNRTASWLPASARKPAAGIAGCIVSARNALAEIAFRSKGRRAHPQGCFHP